MISTILNSMQDVMLDSKETKLSLNSKPILFGSMLAFVLFLSACGVFRPDRALHTVTGVAAHDLCSEVFVSGLDPDRIFTESLKPRPGFELVAWALQYSVEREQRQVRAWLPVGVASRAVFRDGLGCILVHGDETVDSPALGLMVHAPSLLGAIGGPDIVDTVAPQVKVALDAIFTEPAQAPYHWTKAAVVLHDGKIIAERYAPGYGIDTPILGFSMSKSVTNALIGILVRDGKLDEHAPAPVPAWKDAADPRHAITIEQLMRMESGLDLDETGSGFDPSNRMLYDEPDMAAYAERAKLLAAPGTRWSYSSASTHILDRIIRDKVGGNAEAVQRFAFKELFDPLGMQHMTMEMDATGTPVGGHYMLASARDWARFGSLYLNDGVIGGKRILPEGWTRFSSTPTMNTDYGAGWWTNRTAISDPPGERRLVMPLMPGVPSDAYYALGNLGQFVVVVPSERLVVVRMGRSHEHDFDLKGLERLIVSSIAAVKS